MSNLLIEPDEADFSIGWHRDSPAGTFHTLPLEEEEAQLAATPSSWHGAHRRGRCCHSHAALWLVWTITNGMYTMEHTQLTPPPSARRAVERCAAAGPHPLPLDLNLACVMAACVVARAGTAACAVARFALHARSATAAAQADQYLSLKN
jgi:hypothetical protein